MLHTVLLIVQLFCALGVVCLVLLQRGKGAEAGAGFGSGASGTVFGARGATTALSRATAILAALFMITSLSLAYLGTHGAAAVPSSLLDRLSQQPAATPAVRTVAPAAPTPVAPVAPAPAPAPAPAVAPAAGGATGTH
jgi:preprotein translocase subunit SecG